MDALVFRYIQNYNEKQMEMTLKLMENVMTISQKLIDLMNKRVCDRIPVLAGNAFQAIGAGAPVQRY